VRREDRADEIEHHGVGGIDEMTAGDEHFLRAGKGVSEAVNHAPQDLRRVFGGDDQGGLAYRG
jgi:hypothetical protein